MPLPVFSMEFKNRMPQQFEIPDVSLEENSLLAEAEQRAGSSDWGDRTFMQALQVLLDCIDREAALSHLGRFLNWRNITRVLTNRLLLVKLRSKPDYAKKETCQKPIFIFGLPRTGTTLLHNLLIQDPGVHYLRLCDGMYPVPPPHPHTWNDETDPRIEKARQYTTNAFAMHPELRTVHDMDATGPEECLWLFEHQFMDPIFAVRMHIPSYSDWLLQIDHADSYAEYHALLNLLAMNFPGRRWVLKAPRHIYFIEALLHEFPDACIVWTHRDPVKVIPSMASLSYLYRKPFSENPDPRRAGAFQLYNTSTGLSRGLAARDHADASHFYDVHYHQFLGDPLREIRKMYEFFDLSFPAEMGNAIRQWHDQNPQHKHGKHAYSPEDFGLDRNQIRKEFSDYISLFNISPELD